MNYPLAIVQDRRPFLRRVTTCVLATLCIAAAPAAAQPGNEGPAPASAATVTVEHIEAGQAVQNSTHDVRVLSGRNTLVRAYVRASAAQVPRVRGTLQVTNRSTGTTTRYPSVNELNLSGLPATLRDLRADASRSLNFMVPAADVRDGDVDVVLSDVTAADGVLVVCANCRERPLAVRVERAPPLRLVLVGLRYTDGAGTRYTPRVEDFTALESWLRRAYPVGDLRVSRRIVDVTDRAGFPCETANARLAAIRASDMRNRADQRTHYYALVSDGAFFMRGCAAGIPTVPDPTVVASGPAGAVGFPWDKDGSYADWYGGHEIAHTLGRFHIGACNQTREDTRYPYTDGRLSSADADFLGWDAGDPARAPGTLLPGDMWHDVMSYCANQWVSDYTYEALHERLIAEDRWAAGPHVPGAEAPGGAAGRAPSSNGGAPPAPPTAGDPQPRQPAHMAVVAVVNLTQGTGSIVEIAPTSPSQGPAPAADGRATVRVSDAQGVIATYPVWLRESTDRDEGEDRTASVHEVIPFSPAVAKVELLLDGLVLDTRTAGRNSPALQVVNRPAAGPAPAGFPVTFTWRARDPDAGDRLTYTVRILFEGSDTWETFATGWPSAQITLDRDQLMGRRVHQLEVTASDGIQVDEVRAVSP